MRKKLRRGRRKKNSKKAIWIAVSVLAVVCAAGGIVTAVLLHEKKTQEKPEDVLTKYMSHITKQEYEEMYRMIAEEESGNITQEDFVTRNSNIYEGIGTLNVKIENITSEKGKGGAVTVSYQSVLDTSAGKISFDNEVEFVKEAKKYALVWNDSVIFPDLEAGDKVRVSTTEAKRGRILDRNGTVLAGEGTASSVGIVPGKLEDRQAALEQAGSLLGMDAETIEKMLDAGWVQDDSFVPLKTIPKLEEIDMMTEETDEETLKKQDRQNQLLEIPGVMISDTEVRTYPLKEAAAHLTGYVQSVTAEDLEEHAGEGYNSNSVIGRSGMEGLFEKELKGQNGCEIYITDENGDKKVTLADTPVEDGQDVQLTIDAALQKSLYGQFKEDKSCSVAMNPYTGEILALVSTPSFDDNDFIMGMSGEEWTALDEDERQPMYNRFRQVWCPGSTFKPVVAAIGLDAGAIDPDEDYGNVGRSWQKDASWGDYYVTTLEEYEPVVLENALIYSDNIYFAKAALKIGEKTLTDSLDKLGFNQEIPFEITLKQSQYSNSETIESEILLADSGYGQGQVLMNPVHLASLYTAFANGGNVIKPHLLYDAGKDSEVWIQGAFSADAAGRVLEGMKKVVNTPEGTGYAAHREDTVLAGKTGTAEIKASKDDETGTELGWFAVFTADETVQTPVLVVSMVEDVKEIGGSGYVVNKDKNVLDEYLVVNP